jgi:drug/metabolite transporter (DMT)-like permease
VTKFIFILLIALVFEAIGVVFLSGGLNQIGEPKALNAAEIMSLIKRGATNKNILTGTFFEAIFFGFLLYLLSQRDVSIVWPLTALGFVITSLAARIFLKEEISSLRWAGICYCVGRRIGYMERKAEGEKARRATAGFDRLRPSITADRFSPAKSLI